MKIVVIGGSGLIGSKVISRLTAAGHEAVSASPNTGVNTLTGEGLADVLVGASVVIDVSNSPSFEVGKGDKITVMPSSQKKPLFKDFEEKAKAARIPSWLSYDADKKTASAEGSPKWDQKENLFNLGQVIEFYSR